MDFRFDEGYAIWKDLAHYALVYGVLLAVWLPVMNATGNDLPRTAVTVGVIFVLVDKFAHWFFNFD